MKIKTNIIVVEDQKVFRNAVVKELALLGINTLAEANNGVELINLLSIHKPDVVLLDTEMPIMDGLETLKQLSNDFPEIKVIILSSHTEEVIVKSFLDLGARGYLTKDIISENFQLLIDAIEKVKNESELVVEIPAPKIIVSVKKPELTEAEKAGKTNEELAAEMGIILKDSALGTNVPDETETLENASGFFKHTFGKGFGFILKDKEE